MLDQPDLLRDKVTYLVGEGKAMDIVHLDLSKAFDCLKGDLIAVYN